MDNENPQLILRNKPIFKAGFSKTTEELNHTAADSGRCHRCSGRPGGIELRGPTSPVTQELRCPLRCAKLRISISSVSAWLSDDAVVFYAVLATT